MLIKPVNLGYEHARLNTLCILDDMQQGCHSFAVPANMQQPHSHETSVRADLLQRQVALAIQAVMPFKLCCPGLQYPVTQMNKAPLWDKL